MAGTVMKDTKSMSGNETQSAVNKSSDVEFAKCDCCGLTEECTPTYISRVRERHQGRWICGLCAEAVKDEAVRSERRIGTEEALNRHMNFYKKFRSSSPPPNPTEDLISAVKQLLLRTLDSPRSNPPTPVTRNEGSVCVCGSSLVRPESSRSTLDA